MNHYILMIYTHIWFPKGNHFWIFVGRTDAEAETPILWPPDVKSWLIWKDPDAGKDWRREKGMTEDEMSGWHHWLDGHEFEQALAVGDGQGGLACCSPCGHKELDTTEWLNWIELMYSSSSLKNDQYQPYFISIWSTLSFTDNSEATPRYCMCKYFNVYLFKI